MWKVGLAHAALMLESLERSKHGSKAEGSLSTSVQDNATDWSNLRESCGGWLKLRHCTQFAVIGWCCAEVANRSIAKSWRVWLKTRFHKKIGSRWTGPERHALWEIHPRMSIDARRIHECHVYFRWMLEVYFLLDVDGYCTDTSYYETTSSLTPSASAIG